MATKKSKRKETVYVRDLKLQHYINWILSENIYNIGITEFVSKAYCHLKRIDGANRETLRISWEFIFMLRQPTDGYVTGWIAFNIPAALKYCFNTAKTERDKDKKAKLNGFVKILQNFEKWQQKAIVADQLNAVQPLRRVFQTDILDFNNIHQVFEDCMSDLEHLKENMGQREHHLCHFNDNKSKWIELKEDTQSVRNLWNSNSIRVFRSHQDHYSRNVFLKESNIQIHYYHDDIKTKNQEFKVTLCDITLDKYKKRFDNLKDLEFLRVFNPKSLKEYFKTHSIPDDIKQSKNKNRIINWYIEQAYGLDDLEKSLKKWGGYYNIDSIDFERREFIYILHKYKEYRFMRDLYKNKYVELKAKCPSIALLGRHQLIVPFDAAMCDRGFNEQNLHITKRRTLIGTNLLRNLLTICLNGPKWEQESKVYDVLLEALVIWGQNKKYKY